MSKTWVKEGIFTQEQIDIINSVSYEYDLQEADYECKRTNPGILSSDVSLMTTILTIALSMFVFIGIQL
jgi:hypothetical protein